MKLVAILRIKNQINTIDECIAKLSDIVDEIIVLDTHDDNPPDNDNWHTDVTFIATPPAGAILAAVFFWMV